MKDNETRQRNRDLVTSFWKICQAIRKVCPDASYESIIEIAYQSPAPRYYTSYEIARRYVSQIHRGQSLSHGRTSLSAPKSLIRNKDNQYEINFKPNKMTMYYDLYHELIKRTGSHIISYAPLQEIILEPAPSFYLSRHTFRWIIEKTLTGKI